jgi:hypothetical protein
VTVAMNDHTLWGHQQGQLRAFPDGLRSPTGATGPPWRSTAPACTRSQRRGPPPRSHHGVTKSAKFVVRVSTCRPRRRQERERFAPDTLGYDVVLPAGYPASRPSPRRDPAATVAVTRPPAFPARPP